MTKASDIITIKGNGYTAQFDIKTGTIYSLTYGNEKVITDGNGPKLDALRAFTNNDNWFYSQWFAQPEAFSYRVQYDYQRRWYSRIVIHSTVSGS